MARTKDQIIPALFRYFMGASLMRGNFDAYLRAGEDGGKQQTGDSFQEAAAFLTSKAGLTMFLWYGMLYVVIEGYQQSKLSDPEIDRLLGTSRYVRLLKAVRNGTFHFQPGHWLSPKQSDFCGEPGTVEWVRALTAEFRRYFLDEMKRISAKT